MSLIAPRACRRIVAEAESRMMLLGHSVFVYGRRGMAIGAIVGAIAGAAFTWHAGTRQQA